MRTPSMTVQQAESEIGPRGHVFINSDNRALVRKWLVANGYPAAFCATLGNADLAKAYNETDGAGLAVLNRKLKLASESPLSLAPVADIPFSDGSRPSDLYAAADAVSYATLPPPAPLQNNAPATYPEASSNIPFANALTTGSVVFPAPAADKGKQLLEILQSIGTLDKDAVESIVESRLTKFRDLLPDFVAACSPVSRIEILRPDATIHRIEGITHPRFQTLVKLATSRESSGFVPGIFIAGEASSGKTTGCRMLAESLNLPWHFNGAISQPHEMLGWRDGMGHYHRTPFREAYEHGGVYTFDEVDRSDAVALLAVNPHLANGIATFPDGQIKRHPNCIIVCTANTWGLGGSSDYAGATKLDGAFLSRFPSKLHWDIDEATEIHISGNESWALRVQSARRKARAAGLKVMIDVRITIAGAAHIANGMTSDEAAACTYLANLKPEQRAIVES